jgi:hypothetical protein
MEQIAVYESKRLGDCELCNTMRFECISCSSTLAYTRDILEHRYAANNIWSIPFESHTKEILKEVC